MSAQKRSWSKRFGAGKKSRRAQLKRIREEQMPTVSDDSFVEGSVLPSSSNNSTEGNLSASAKKLDMFKDIYASDSDSSVQESCCNSPAYIIVDINCLNSLFANVNCRKCNASNLSVKARDIGAGIVSSLEVTCLNCREIISICTTSQRIGSASSRSPYEVSRRVTMAMMEMGTGFAGLEKFTAIMGMPCMHHKTFAQHTKHVSLAAETVASSVLKDAASFVRKAYCDLNPSLAAEVINIGVSFDGTWMKRGHTSNYGIGVCIDILTGLVLDYEVLSKYCQSCSTTGEKLKSSSPTEYGNWWENHKNNCDKNYNGTSGGMEVEAANRIWRRSLELHRMRYTTVLSDGDSKMYRHLQEINDEIYGKEHCIVKEECINHVSKRLGTALRNIRKEKSLGGKGYGRLTDITIQKLTKYYENAIRNNVGNLESMRCAVFASWMHCISTDEAPHHTRCPSGVESWCFYNRALARGEEPRCHKDLLGTPLCPEVGEAVKPVYQRLADPSLLQRCLQGKTQNTNESLHSKIWQKCPKTQFVSQRRVQAAASSAIAEFNCGKMSVKSTLEIMGIIPGKLTSAALLHKDEERREKSNRKVKESEKQRRRQQTLAKLREEEQQKSNEDTSYEPGNF